MSKSPISSPFEPIITGVVVPVFALYLTISYFFCAELNRFAISAFNSSTSFGIPLSGFVIYSRISCSPISVSNVLLKIAPIKAIGAWIAPEATITITQITRTGSIALRKIILIEFIKAVATEPPALDTALIALYLAFSQAAFNPLLRINPNPFLAAFPAFIDVLTVALLALTPLTPV